MNIFLWDRQISNIKFKYDRFHSVNSSKIHVHYLINYGQPVQF